jgi:hypothetical protein
MLVGGQFYPYNRKIINNFDFALLLPYNNKYPLKKVKIHAKPQLYPHVDI